MADPIIGDDGDNGLVGTGSNDQIFGLGGNDVLEGRGGDDLLDGGSGRDLANYGPASGSVVVDLAAGTASGADGNDTLISIEDVLGSNFDDTLTGDDGYNVLNGAGGNDTIHGAGGDDTVMDGEGDDQLFGDEGNDQLIGGIGDDLLDGGTGEDIADYSRAVGAVVVDLGSGTATGADGSDTLANIEWIQGSGYDDSLTGDGGYNFISGGGGDDVIHGAGGDDGLFGGDGNDQIHGDDGNDQLVGGAGDDMLDGGDGEDIADYGGAAGSVVVDLGASTATGADGNDTLSSIEWIQGSAFDDTLTGDGGYNYINGGSGDDAIYGAGGSDTLVGGDGNDSLHGGDDNDQLMGDAGDDLLDGGAGRDVAEYQNASGAVTVDLSSGTAGGADGNDTLVGIEDILGSAFDDQLTGDDASDGNFINAGDGNDVVAAGGGDDYVLGGLGDDTIAGGAGYDTLDGGDGNDTLDGGADNDQLYGGNGNDTASYASATGGVQVAVYFNGTGGEAFGAAGYDQLHDIENLTGSAFDDTLTGNNLANVLTGGDGNDGLGGGGGNDTLDGGDGYDALSGGGGNDTLLAGSGNDFLNGGFGNDTIDGGEGFDRAGYFGGATSGVTVDLRLQGVAQNVGEQGFDTLTNIEGVSGTLFADTLTGDDTDNWLWGSTSFGGMTNNDALDGQGGNDVLGVGIGNHTLTGGSGIDTVAFTENGGAEPNLNVSLALQGAAQATGAGNWTLNGIENLSGGLGNDALTGDGGNNVLAGYTGNDTLVGGAGNDVLYGDGLIWVDTRPTGGSGPITTFTDATELDPAAIDGNDTLEGGLGNDTLNGGGGSDTATYANTIGGGVNVNLALGTATGAAGNDTLISIENIIGSNAGDSIFGDANANRLEGGDGNDRLISGAGNDLLYGGNGNDILKGQLGDDLFDGGAGIDIAKYYQSDAALGGVTVSLLLQGSAQYVGSEGWDTLVSIENLYGTPFADTITGDNGDNWLSGSEATIEGIGVSATNNDVIDGGGGNDVISVGIGNHNLTGGSGNDTLWFTEAGFPEVGVTIDLNLQGGAQTTGAGSWTLNGFENVVGGQLNDVLTGDGGGNLLAGDSGNDTLIGGAGDDQLYGDGAIGFANNVLLAGISDAAAPGNDTLEGGLGNDTIDGGGGIDTATYAHASGGVSVNLTGGFASGSEGNDTLVNIENVTGSEFADNIIGSAVGNVLDGLGGNDTIQGRDGNDTIYGGDGDDFLLGDAGETSLAFSGDDTLYGGNGNDGLRGGLGNDQLYGGANNDLLRGNAGVDYFDGGSDDGEGFNGIGDRVSFFEQRATQGAVADLRTGIISNDGFGNVESMVNIESLGADTAYVDTFYGNDARNFIGGSRGDNLYGFGGDDLFQTGAAAAVVDGGTGIDLLQLDASGGWLTPDANADGLAESAAAATAGWTVNLTAGMTLDGYGNAGTVTGIENVNGSALGDSITGAVDANVLNGLDGNDTLNGRGGNDTIDGGNGSDTASYANASGAVIVNLTTGTSSGADGNDTLVSIENLIGSGFDDTLTGNDQANQIEGGDGADFVRAGGGNDLVYGGNGNDILKGQDGDDLINGGAGIDRAGYYQADPTLGGVTVSLLLQGTAQNVGSQGWDTLVGIENVFGTPFADSLTGDDGNNWLSGSEATIDVGNVSASNNDLLDGQGGNDLLSVGIGNQMIIGGTGNDTLWFSENGFPESGIAVSLALQGAAQTTGNGSWTLTGIENLTGGVANDRLTGDGNINVLGGGAGSDTLIGGAGNDVLYGDGGIAVDGHDVITTFTDVATIIAGGIGSDVAMMPGVDGNDLLEGGLGNDLINGGGGTDTATYANASGAVTVTLTATGGSSSGADGSDTLVSIENVTGSAFNDAITGNSGNNVLIGGAGADSLSGGVGNDTLVGGLGADILDGGTGTGIDIADYSASAAGVSVNLQNGRGSGGDAQGDTLSNIENILGSAFVDNLVGSSTANVLNGGGGNDTLTGGAGSDLFAFKALADIGVGATTDAITDFQAGGLGAATAIDHIDLSAIDANSRTTRDDAFNYIGTGAFSGRAGELRYDGAGHLLGDVNGDGIADFSLALTVTGTLDGTDFVL